LKNSQLKWKNSGSHFPAFFRTPAAGLGAFPAVVVVHGVFFTFGRTGFTDFRANRADFSGIGTAEAHYLCCRTANSGAFEVELNAPHQIMNL
jgi:hypothetical protein